LTRTKHLSSANSVTYLLRHLFITSSCLHRVLVMAANQIALHLKLRELHVVTASRDETKAWLRANGLLATGAMCQCGNVMFKNVYSQAVDRSCWRCPEHRCRKVANLRKGSFWERYIK